MSADATKPARYPVRPTTSSLRLALVLVAIGGYLDAYTYLQLDGVFANAQTANVVLLGVQGANGDWSTALHHLPPILAFIAGVAVAELLRRRGQLALHRPARLVLLLQIVLLVAVGFAPASVPQAVVVIVLAFGAALQSTMFTRVRRWPYTPTLTTVTMRSMTSAAVGAWLDRDREAARQAATYAPLVLGFFAGALLGGLLTLHLHAHAAWPAAGLVAIAVVLYAVGATATA